MIEIRIDELLGNRGRTFYWLAKETGISHTTLWRLKKGRALGINFETLEKICQVLKCNPGDVLSHTNTEISKAPRPKAAPRSSKSLPGYAVTQRLLERPSTHGAAGKATGIIHTEHSPPSLQSNGPRQH